MTGAKCDGIRQLHDSIVNHLPRCLKHAQVPHKVGAWGNPKTCKENFSEQIDRLSDNDSGSTRWLHGVIPDQIISALYLVHLEKGEYARF